MLVKQVPNLITCANLFCGAFAVTLVFKDDLYKAMICFCLSLIFDFLDGFMARLLNAYSAIGKQLDSLADLVSFGLLPTVILYQMLEQANTYLAYIAFLIVIFSAIRLAKFNIDENQTHHFIGLPTPANALLIVSIPMIVWQMPSTYIWLGNPLFLIGLILISSYLLVAHLPLFSLKIKSLSWETYKVQFIFIAFSLFLLVFLWFLAIPLIICLYVLLSLIYQPKIKP